jgi:hypothetical protein
MRQTESLRLEGDEIVLRGSKRVGFLDPELNHPTRDEVRRLLERDRAVQTHSNLAATLSGMGEIANAAI